MNNSSHSSRWRRRFKVVIIVTTIVLLLLFVYSKTAVSEIEKTYPPTGRFIKADNTRLHYIDKGADKNMDETILLLHGASTSLRDFEASIIPELERTNRVLAFDRPGYGYSESNGIGWVNPAEQAELIRNAVTEINIKQTIVVGHSLGGAVALAYALKYPEEVNGVVLIGGAAYPWSGGVVWHNHLATWPVVGSIFTSTLVIPAGKLLFEDAVASVFAPNSVVSNYINKTGLELSLRPKAFRASAMDVVNLSPYLEAQSEYYAELTMPVLIITGENDDIVPAWNHADRLIKILPDAELIKLPDTGHAPHHIDPAGITKLIRDFAVED